MKCYNCGTTLENDALFCSECGKEQGFSKELIQRAKSGDQDALTELYQRTYTAVYQTAVALVRDEDTALDILQDSYLKAFRSLDQLKDVNKFGAWMKRIAHNRAVDHLRKTKPVVFSRMSYDSDEAVEFEDDRTENLPEAVIDQNETARLMGEILDGLSPDQRAVIIMFYYEQMSVKQIAHDLRLNENTVKSRLLHGRRYVESAVKNLEKKGTKLYGLAPVPFMLLLFRGWEAQAAALHAPGVLNSILHAFYTGASAAANAGAVSAAGAGAPGGASTGTSAAAGMESAGGASAGTSTAAGMESAGGASTGTSAAAGAKSAGTGMVSAAGAGTSAAGGTGIASAAGAAGKGILTKVLIGVLAVGVTGGAVGAAVYHTQKAGAAQEAEQEEPQEEAESAEDTTETERPQRAEEPEEPEPQEEPEKVWLGESEPLYGSWDAFVDDENGSYVISIGFGNDGYAEYKLGWRDSELALATTGTYAVDGTQLHLIFETNELTGEPLNWNCTYNFETVDSMLLMEWVSGDTLNFFQMDDMLFGYNRASILTEADERYICEQLGVPENIGATVVAGEEYYWEGANMMLIPVSVYAGNDYVAGADVDKESKELARSIWSYQN